MYALEWERLFGFSVALVMLGAAVAIVAFAPRRGRTDASRCS